MRTDVVSPMYSVGMHALGDIICDESRLRLTTDILLPLVYSIYCLIMHYSNIEKRKNIVCAYNDRIISVRYAKKNLTDSIADMLLARRVAITVKIVVH